MTFTRRHRKGSNFPRPGNEVRAEARRAKSKKLREGGEIKESLMSFPYFNESERRRRLIKIGAVQVTDISIWRNSRYWTTQ